MIDMLDIFAFSLLESKYGADLEHYDKKKNKYFLKKCIKANSDYLDLMKDTQKILAESILVQNKSAEQFEKIKELKQIFDEYLEYMNRLSKCLDIVITPSNLH
jgi:hypothetical protein